MNLISEQEYLTLVENKKSFCVQFSATWCMPCLEMTRTLESIEDEVSIPVYKMDVDDSPNVSDDLSIRSIPTLVIIRDGEIEDILVGLQKKEKIKSVLR